MNQPGSRLLLFLYFFFDKLEGNAFNDLLFLHRLAMKSVSVFFYLPSASAESD